MKVRLGFHQRKLGFHQRKNPGGNWNPGRGVVPMYFVPTKSNKSISCGCFSPKWLEGYWCL